MEIGLRQWIALVESLRATKIADIDFDAAVRHHDLPDAGGISNYRRAFQASKAELVRLFAKQKVRALAIDGLTTGSNDQPRPGRQTEQADAKPPIDFSHQNPHK